jgi:ATP-binding cassette, subfamily B, bacterial
MAESNTDPMRAPSHSLWRLVRPYRGILALAFVAMAIESAAAVWEPWPLKLIIDNVLGAKPLPPAVAAWAIFGTTPLGVLNAAVVGLLAITAIGAAASFGQKYLATAVGQHITQDLRKMLYHRVQGLPLPFFETRRTGDLIVRLTSDVDAAQDFFSTALLSIAMDLLTLGGILAVMLYLDWRFTLLSLAVAPLLFAVVYRRTHRIKEAAREVKAREAGLASIVQETIAAVRTVRAFGREAHEEKRLAREGHAAMQAALRARSIKAALPPAVDLIVAAGTCVVMLVGVRLVLEGRITSGILIVFVLYLGKLYKPMKNLARMTDTVAKSTVAFERIRELLATPDAVADAPGARPAPRFRGAIDFRDVTFGYTQGPPVLQRLTLTAAAGQRVAIVGATGSGKSTLLALLLRLYEPDSGSIRIDGTDIRRFTVRSLRDQISVVPQDPVLFRATVWENIAYGRPGATRDDVIRAARLANAHEFIARMPRGYDTLVGERGETLSGGQRQRVAIARAVIREAPILLLDEPSAALDPESEALVFDALSRLMDRCTSITIAHRLATVRRAQLVTVLDRGTIAACGTHEELLVAHAPYMRLFALSEPQDDADVRPAIAV